MRTVVLAIVLAISGGPAPAQCASFPQIAAKLADDYGERPIGMGINRNGAHIVVFVGPGGGYSITMPPPGKPTCIGDVGTDWQIPPQPASGEPT